MKDKKLAPDGEPSFNDIGKWLDNFWYHYKIQFIIAVVAIITIVISTYQFLTRETYDYTMLYAGPQIVMLQDINYMEAAVEELADDLDGNGKISVAIEDIVMLSPEEQAAATKAGAALDPQFINTSMKEYTQQIFGGDAVICLLSPYMYEIVHEEGGFMPLTEIFTELPEAAYDECGIVLSKTEFGRYFNGINDLPDNTILCIRKLSSMAIFKGVDKTEAAHQASIELFKRIVEYEAPEDGIQASY